MNYAQGAREEAAFYVNNPMPMTGYTSPEQIAVARANAAYYNQHPGGMTGWSGDGLEGWSDSGLEGIGDVFTSKNLMYAAIGAVAASFLLPKKYRPKGKYMTLGVGAAAGLIAAKMM